MQLARGKAARIFRALRSARDSGAVQRQSARERSGYTTNKFDILDRAIHRTAATVVRSRLIWGKGPRSWRTKNSPSVGAADGAGVDHAAPLPRYRSPVSSRMRARRQSRMLRQIPLRRTPRTSLSRTAVSDSRPAPAPLRRTRTRWTSGAAGAPALTGKAHRP